MHFSAHQAHQSSGSSRNIFLIFSNLCCDVLIIDWCGFVFVDLFGDVFLLNLDNFIGCDVGFDV